MARIDCTNSGFRNFRDLINFLRSQGFQVDHFHAVERLEVKQKNEFHEVTAVEGGLKDGKAYFILLNNLS